MSIYLGFQLSGELEDRIVRTWQAGRDASGEQLVRVGQGSPAKCEVSFGRIPWAEATAGRLKWVQLDSVGFDDLLPHAKSLSAAGVRVTNLAGFFADPVAETVLAGVLSVMRGLPRLQAAQHARSWEKMDVRPVLRSLRGANVLLAGYGSIGQRFEQLLQPFECRVKHLSKNPAGQSGQGLSSPDFDAELANADVVVCSLPETPATVGLFNQTRFARMKPGAVFANVGRGGVVDETALAEVLHAGRLGGAVIDVTVQEPLPPGHPLWGCPNILLTQHTAGGGHDENERKVDAFLANLRRYLAGQPLHGLIDFARGY